jgi:RNA polymerase sigma-54 factor
MSNYIAQTQDPGQRQTTTLHLAQTMYLLELNSAELADEVARELSTNPALQLVEDHRCPRCGRRVRSLPCPACLDRHTGDEPIVFLSPRPSSAARGRDDEDAKPSEDRIPQTETLFEHLLRQVACEHIGSPEPIGSPITDAASQRIAASILARLDDRGLLTETPAEIALHLRVSLEAVTHVLSLIQHADPPGVATRDLRESLLIQLEARHEFDPVHPLVREVLESCWEQLGKRNYQAIARKLKVEVEDIEEVVRFIHRNLTPYPARAWHEAGKIAGRSAQPVFYQPDIVISHNPRPGGPLVVEVFTGLGGALRVDPNIKASLPQLTDEERSEWSAHIERANLLAKCFQQRNHTMVRLAEIIVSEQRAFVLGGDGDLKPLTRCTLAERLDLHESTVSRAVAHKSAALPNGRIVPLSIFFDRSLAVRDAVQAIIRQEMRTRPLSDTQIVELLKPQGYNVARRTVAKYRQMLGILPANLRGRELTLSL